MNMSVEQKYGINDLKTDHFLFSPNEYKREISPLKQYVEQQAQFLSIMESIPYKEAIEFVSKQIKTENRFKNPKVIYVRKDENDDRVKDETTLLTYLKETIDNKDIMSATFTTFLHHDKKVAYVTEYVDQAFPKRKALKKRQFQKRQEGDTVGEAFANNGQNNIKRSINSISGASSITSTPIYNASMHPVLTSNCRMTSGYANANNEKLLGGNRHYHNAEITLNNLVALTTNINEELIESVIAKYNLHVPNPLELFEYIYQSTSLYWRWRDKEDEIKEFLFKCNSTQRAAIAYIYDLNALRVFNPEFTLQFIGKLAEVCNPIPGMSIEEAQYLFNQASEEIRNVAIQCHAPKVKGLKTSQYIETDTILYLAACIVNVYNVLDNYQDYIKAFLCTKHMPSSLAQLPNGLRKIVLMSDTDSSIFTTKHWTKWYYGKDYGSVPSLPMMGVMTMLSSMTLRNLLAIMSTNLGVPDKYRFEIAMKNEFSFPVLVNLNRTKHYIATRDYQEGNVLPEVDIEKKGVHLRNSNSPQEIIRHAQDIMERLFYFHGRDKIKLMEILKEVADEERKIFQAVERGDSTYYRSKQIKDKLAYKDNEEISPYHHFVFWNNTFGKFYGEISEPPYSAFDVKIDTDSPKKTKEWLESFENQELANLIWQDLQKRGKDKLGTISIPYELFISKPIPKEIIPVVAKRDLVANICSPYYIALEAVGVYLLDKNNTKLLSDYY